RTFARMALGEAAVNVGLSLVLAPRFGLVGIAVSVAVPNLVMCLWVIAHTTRGLGVSAARYLADVCLRPLAARTGPLAVWLVAGIPALGWAQLTTAILMGLVPYAVTVLVVEGRLPVRRRHWARQPALVR